VNEQDSSGALAPPPVFFGIALAVGFVLDAIWPQPILPQTIQYIVGFPLIVLSILAALTVVREFRRHKTNLDVHKPTTAIIATGPFRFSRNPVYLSLVVLVTGIAVAVDSYWLLITMLPAIAVVHKFVILREEAYLTRKFGDDYLSYKSGVRRWL